MFITNWFGLLNEEVSTPTLEVFHEKLYGHLPVILLRKLLGGGVSSVGSSVPCRECPCLLTVRTGGTPVGTVWVGY